MTSSGSGSKRCQPLGTTGFSLFFLLPIGFFRYPVFLTHSQVCMGQRRSLSHHARGHISERFRCRGAALFTCLTIPLWDLFGTSFLICLAVDSLGCFEMHGKDEVSFERSKDVTKEHLGFSLEHFPVCSIERNMKSRHSRRCLVLKPSI